MNVGHDGQRVAESQTKAEFHDYGDMLIVARSTRLDSTSRCFTPL